MGSTIGNIHPSCLAFLTDNPEEFYGDVNPGENFGIGNLTDTHMDTDLSEEKLAKRFNEAIENTKRMGGKVSSGMMENLGFLISPKMTWEDFVTISIGNRKNGFGKNDWNTPRSRSLFFWNVCAKKENNSF